MKRIPILMLCAGALLTVACACHSSSNGAAYSIYGRADMIYTGGGDAVSSFRDSAEGETDARKASELLWKMIESDRDDCRTPMPDGTRVLGVEIEQGLATVNLSKEYAALSGMDLTLADSCITLTLCQLPTVDRVSVLVEGHLLPYRDREVLSVDDILLSRMDDEMRTQRVRLYFVDGETGELSWETRVLELYEGQTKAEALMKALMAGPEHQTLKPLLPENVELLSVRVEEGICYVNLSKEFGENIPNSVQRQKCVIYSMVKSLCSISDIQAVQIVVDGLTSEYYGSIDIGKPLN